MTMVVLANILTIPEMGEVSTIYAVTIAGAQIIGYTLGVLALDLSKDASDDPNKLSRMALTCFLWWLSISLLFAGASLFARPSINEVLLNNLVSPYFYAVGVVWLCGMAFELMAVSIAIGSRKMPLLALTASIQAGLMIIGTPLAVFAFGYQGVATLAVLSFLTGLVLIISMAPWRVKNNRIGLFRSGAATIFKLIGPSFLATVCYTSLNILIIREISTEDFALNEMAYFSVLMQILSILMFFPQIIYSFYSQKCFQLGVSHQKKIKLIEQGALVSFFLCALVGFLVYICRMYVMEFYGQKYIHLSVDIAQIGLLLIVQGPMQILTQKYIFDKRHWNLVLISLFSTTSGYLYFSLEPNKSSSTMITALLIANAARIFPMIVGMTLYRFHNRSKD